MNVAEQPIIDVEAHDATGDSGPSASPDADSLADLKDRASERIELARSWIQQNPLPALGIALATGFVIGRIVRR